MNLNIYELKRGWLGEEFGQKKKEKNEEWTSNGQPVNKGKESNKCAKVNWELALGVWLVETKKKKSN